MEEMLQKKAIRGVMSMNEKNEWLQIGKTVVVAVIVAVLFRMFIFSPIVVDGPSMESTLQNGDQMIVNKLTYQLTDPKRFDIIVFHATEEKDFIKRIIGLPGEHVAIMHDDLYIDGELMEEDFLDKSSSKVKNQFAFTLENLVGNYPVIPKDHYLVLGDHRNDSTDSRTFGVIHKDEIFGKTSIIYWPPKRIRIVK